MFGEFTPAVEVISPSWHAVISETKKRNMKNITRQTMSTWRKYCLFSLPSQIMWKLKSACKQTLSYVGKGKAESPLLLPHPAPPPTGGSRSRERGITRRFWNDQGYHQYLRRAWEFWRPDMRRAKWSCRVIKISNKFLWHLLLRITRWPPRRNKNIWSDIIKMKLT